jgi:hypothetical protein
LKVNSGIRNVAAVSLFYDALVGVVMLAGRPLLSRLFSVPLPVPPIHADLNGVFLIAVASGYLITIREPESPAGRTYLWVMGPLLKGAGALTFLLDYFVRGTSPPSFLIFAISDGSLALLSLWVLLAATATASPQPSTYQAANSSPSTGA